MSNHPIRLAFLGDLCVGGEFQTLARKHKTDVLKPLRNVEPLLQGIDLGFVNLEGPIYKGPSYRPNLSLHLYNDPEALEFCCNRNLRMMSLCNNHMLDQGIESLDRTIQSIEEAGISGVGACRTSDPAIQHAVIECEGKTFALLGFMGFPDEQDQPVLQSYACDREDESPILTHTHEAVLERIRALKKEVDYVAISLHWGYEYYEYPSTGQRQFAHQLIDAGCKFVIGHHAHVLQGMETYKDGLILYCLGNLFLPPHRSSTGRLQYQKKLTRKFVVVYTDINEDGSMKIETVGGYRTRDLVLHPYHKKEKPSFQEHLKKLSTPFSDPNYADFWNRYKEMREKQLHRESIVEAFKKIANYSPSELLSTIRPQDISRNLRRIGRILTGRK